MDQTDSGTELDELTLIIRAQDGDLQAFEKLVTSHQGGIFRLAYRMLNNRSDAEDIVQETFIAALRSLSALTNAQMFVPWLYRTATNKCIDSLRQRRSASGTGRADLDDQLHTRDLARTSVAPSSTFDPAQEAESEAQMRALAQLLEAVPPGAKACWLLREVHDFSYGEIAQMLQLPQSTVRGRIARAKRFLAEGMEPWR